MMTLPKAKTRQDVVNALGFMREWFNEHDDDLRRFRVQGSGEKLKNELSAMIFKLKRDEGRHDV